MLRELIQALGQLLLMIRRIGHGLLARRRLGRLGRLAQGVLRLARRIGQQGHRVIRVARGRAASLRAHVLDVGVAPQRVLQGVHLLTKILLPGEQLGGLVRLRRHARLGDLGLLLARRAFHLLRRAGKAFRHLADLGRQLAQGLAGFGQGGLGLPVCVGQSSFELGEIRAQRRRLAFD